MSQNEPRSCLGSLPPDPFGACCLGHDTHSVSDNVNYCSTTQQYLVAFREGSDILYFALIYARSEHDAGDKVCEASSGATPGGVRATRDGIVDDLDGGGAALHEVDTHTVAKVRTGPNWFTG